MRDPSFLKRLFRLVFPAVALIVVFGLFVSNNKGKAMLSQLWGLNQLYFFEVKKKLKTRLLPRIDKRFVFTVDESFSPRPTANITGGFYRGPVTVHLSSTAGENVAIYYTLDGSTPTKRSRRYRDAINIDKTAALRFRGFRAGYLPSETVTHTYFINADIRMAVVSLVVDPIVLWNKHSGIHANAGRRGKKWERTADVEYYEPGEDEPLCLPVRLRIHGGGWARKQDKKAFRITYSTASAEKYSATNLLTERSPEAERTVILRPTIMNLTARLGEELLTRLYSGIGGFTSESTEVILFINGDLWGFYRLHERINEEYLRRNVGEGDYNLIKNQRTNNPALAGDVRDWENTLEFFRSHDLSDDEEFKKARELVDVENTTDYWLLNIYAGNYDWPHNNSYVFKKRNDPDSKWRWISWDPDFAFRPDVAAVNTLAWATRNEPRTDLVPGAGRWSDKTQDFFETLIVRGLLENEAFRRSFVRRFCDLLNYPLKPDRVEAELDELLAAKSHDIQLEWARWPGSKDRYLAGASDMRRFIYKRPRMILDHFRDEFKLGDLFEVNIDSEPRGAGQIQVNTITPQHYPWSGRYFENTTVVVTAKPSNGFTFVRWADPVLGKDPELILTLDRNIELRALYQKTGEKRR